MYIHKDIRHLDVDIHFPKHRRIQVQVSASAFVSVYAFASLKHMDIYSNEIFIDKSVYLMSQRIVSSTCFYGAKRPHLDSVMIEEDFKEVNGVAERRKRIWFAKF